MAFAEQLESFFADFGVSATWTPSAGGPMQTATVILDAPDQQLFDGAQVSTDYSISMPAASFVGIDNGETVVIAATNYRVRNVMAIDDGSIKVITLARMS